MHYDIVFHLDKGQDELNIALSNIANYLKALADEKFTAVLLVNGPAITLMVKAADNCAKLAALGDLGLEVRVCNNALTHFGIAPADLCPCCRIVPAGVVELVDLQRQGFAYVKP
ncbi:MAG TPA: DsrE family protein [Solidesulfovibrio magneticus]|nr:DsrE family protein [Solidesulfovibrio magneticus]